MTTPTTGPRRQRMLAALAASAATHALVALLVVFDVLGIAGGLGLGAGPGFGIGSGGGLGLGQTKRREIFALRDLPAPVPPNDLRNEEALKELLVPARPDAITVPQPAAPRPTSPVVRFARPVKPLGSGVDLGSRFASSGAGAGGLGLGGGGGSGVSLGSPFSKYVGGLRKVGLDVALVVDSTGSMQNIIDELKERLDLLTVTMQRLVPTARIGAVAYRDRDDQNVATAPRKSESFVVKWTDLTFNSKKVQSFLDGIVAEGGGDWEEAVKDGVDCAMHQLKWRADAKKVIIVIGSSPPHERDGPALQKLLAGWRAKGGVVSTVDVSLPLHEEHERKLHRWLYGEELQQVSPLPEFYQALRDSFGEIARKGGGDMIAMGQEGALARHLLALTFGPRWEKDVARIARGL
ncbi:MAG TPA: vWA domain-containing protein [Candidatus Binatia bacterium]|nr:vWA domain-containing protein [Candidatus Binatia bacterium]